MGHIFFWHMDFADFKGTTRSRISRAFRWYTCHRRSPYARKRYGRFKFFFALFIVHNNCVSTHFWDKQASPGPPRVFKLTRELLRTLVCHFQQCSFIPMLKPRDFVFLYFGGENLAVQSARVQQ